MISFIILSSAPEPEIHSYLNNLENSQKSEPSLTKIETLYTLKNPKVRVKVSRLEFQTLGSLQIPMIRLEFMGDQTAVDNRVTLFRRRFLTAGG